MNTLTGKIFDIQSTEMISLIGIDVEGDIFSSIILEGKQGPMNYKTNDRVNILFKETEVGLAKNLSGQISLRNRFGAKIQKIERGFILSKITLDYKGQWIRSIISTKSADEMRLQENDPIEWLVKSNEISLSLLIK